MPSKTLISTVMTRNVYTLDVGSKLSEVRHALITHEFHHMPIVDDGRVVGMLSWRDLVRAYRDARGDAEASTFGIDELLDQNATVEEVMTKKLVTIRENDILDRAIDLIADAHIHSVLVLDANTNLVGIVTDKTIVEFLMS
jgi:acetoin utilization protein AcuB